MVLQISAAEAVVLVGENRVPLESSFALSSNFGDLPSAGSYSTDGFARAARLTRVAKHGLASFF